MKVDGGAPRAAMHGGNRLQNHSSQSFAEYLASGKSVGDIRNERAFGFSETGILGAPRHAPDNGRQTPASHSHSPMRAVPLSNAQVSRALASQQVYPPAPTNSHKATERVKPIKNVNGLQAAGGLRNVNDGGSQYPIFIPARGVIGGLTETGNSRPMAGPAVFSNLRKRDKTDKSLQIFENDSGIEILLFSQREHLDNSHVLFCKMFQIAQEFGVTLNAVRLQDAIIESPVNLDKGRS